MEQINKKVVSVWLVVEDGVNRGKIALQKRSSREKNFPFICQSTWAGKVEPGEEEINTVKRECEEEMGCDFFDEFNNFNISFLCKSFAIGWECYNYSGRIKESLICKVKMHEDAFPELLFVGGKDEFYPASSGKNPEDNIVLFNDQYEILKNILNGN